jgi:AcrR family transcriptional regulator
MDEIAERAGVSKPVLYQHFPGKLDLYLELLDAGVEDLLAAARQALTGTTDNALRVQAMVRAYFSFVEEPSGAFRLVFESDLAHEPAVRERMDAADQAMAAMSAAVIAEDTGLSADQALLLASGMQGLVQVSAQRWIRMGAGRPSREQATELVAGLAWRGISSFPLSHPPQAE